MDEQKITSSIKVMIDLFQKHNFQHRNLQQISAELQENPNTINQRLIRDKNYFFQSSTDSKPKEISLNVYRPEVLAYIFHNQCQSCKKTFKSSLLTTYYKDGNKKNKNWGNLQPVCETCQGKLLHSKDLSHSKKTSQKNGSQSTFPIWEYKIIHIKTVLDPEKKYFVFNEDEDNDFPLDRFYWIEENGEIISLHLTSILDYFGNNNWELVCFRDLSKDSPQNVTSFNESVIPFYDPQYIEIECIFKRHVEKK